jgi:hypothetical protein
MTTQDLETQDLETRIEELETRIDELVKHNIELLENLEKEKQRAELNWNYRMEQYQSTERLKEKLNVISKIIQF